MTASAQFQWSKVQIQVDPQGQGVRSVYQIVEKNIKVLLGDGRNTSLYYDIWCTDVSIAEILNDQTLDTAVRVSDVMIEGIWVIPDAHLQRMIDAGLEIDNLPRPLRGEDLWVWMPEFSGEFSVRSAVSLIRKKYPNMDGASLIWRKEIHPVLAAHNWKFMCGACATSDLIKGRFKIQLAKKCCLCDTDEETLDHVLFNCSFAARARNWISGVFGINANSNLIISYKAAKGSPMVRDLWLLAKLVLKSELWAVRNKRFFEQKKPNWSIFYKRVLKIIQDYSVRLHGHMNNSDEDVVILDYFRVRHRSIKQLHPIECFWQPPNEDEILLCCDGAQELYGVIIGLEWATRWGIRKACIRSDSYSVVEALRNSNLPWFARQIWLAIVGNYEAVRFVHTYREANFVADNMAKKGCLLDNGVGIHYEGRPIF
ncbi:uncharacterized protein LOC113316033 [Papaver somniferum]|uniref:uncharacterized protein LOC113316033 n=1 Tax=Papaver somniferum TaxID=3469 RepID=UPI000E6F6DE3|nr:uncharacterized protein LOC113316033 [Papaver somniferum]